VSNYIIVGAGLAGCVLAERIANVLEEKVLIIEKRDHVGGNCYDYYDEAGVLVHKYGPHVFHTQLKEVWEYVSQFTEWHPYQHRVLGSVDGKKIPIPFNLTSLHRSFPPDVARRLEEKLVENYGREVQVPILELKESDDEDLQLLADYVYRKVFLNYTKKQWGMKPEELDPSVTARVPVLVSRDDRYFQDPYQGIPQEGYTPIFEKMLSNPRIEVMLNTDYREVLEFNEGIIRYNGKDFKGKLIYTGEIDYFFNYQYGRLPYRSLRFEMETLDQEFYQEVATVNYPNDHQYTRITEFKHLTGQKHQKTTITREYPQRYQPERGDVPYYPIPRREYREVYQRYQEKADKVLGLILLGRLAEYQYYNMDLVVAKALQIFKEEIR
jgi:UDP-galactopyranose mutase